MKRLGFFLFVLSLYGGIQSAALSTKVKVGLSEVLSDTIPVKKVVVDATVLDELLGDSIPASELQAVDSESQAEENQEEVLSEVEKMRLLILNYQNQQDYFTDRWTDIYLKSPEGVKSDADYYKLAMPATYYAAGIEQLSDISDWEPVNAYSKEDTLKKQVFQPCDLEKTKRVDRQINHQLLSFYLTYPNLVKKNETDFEGLSPLKDNSVPKEKPETEKMIELVDAPQSVGQVDEGELVVLKPNFWKLSGQGDLQFSQTHISDNWYKGGDGTTSLYAHFVWQANYDDQQKIQWDNKIEWKLGFITQPSDTVHTFSTNYDELTLSSKLGIQAAKNWYYTLSAEFETQFFSSFETNSDDLVSALFSPAELNIGLGMDYKYSHGDDVSLSVLMNPVNYTRYSVRSDRVDPTDFNIDEGKKIKNQIGSRIETTLKWKLMDNLTWDASLTYTTDYSYAQLDWENTFTFSFNRYFSAKFFFHPRFDDSVSRDEGESYFQLQEQLSLGLTYSW